MDKIRIGILGQGFIGQVHYEILSQLDEFKVICISDVDANIDRNLKNVKFFDDYRKLLDKESRNIDAVIIALPTAIHLQSVRDSANCDLDMLLEKPMGVNAKEAEEIKEISLAKKNKLMVGMTGRYHPEFVYAYKNLPEIGDIFYFDERIHMGGDPFPLQHLDKKCAGKGVGLTNGIHTVDRFFWFSNKSIEKVNIYHIGNDFFQENLEDNIRGSVFFEGDIEGRFSLRWSNNAEMDYVFEAVGVEGIIRVYGFDKAILLKGKDEKMLFQHDLNIDVRERHKPGIKAELKEFARYLKDESHNNHIEDCIKAQKVIDLIYEQAKLS